MTSPILDPEVEAHRKARAAEYGTWEAAGVIEFGGSRAFNEGDPVPASTVERLKLDELGLVRKQSSKAAQDAATDTGTPDVAGDDLEAQATRRTPKGGSK